MPSRRSTRRRGRGAELRGRAGRAGRAELRGRRSCWACWACRGRRSCWACWACRGRRSCHVALRRCFPLRLKGGHQPWAGMRSGPFDSWAFSTPTSRPGPYWPATVTCIPLAPPLDPPGPGRRSVGLDSMAVRTRRRATLAASTPDLDHVAGCSFRPCAPIRGPPARRHGRVRRRTRRAARDPGHHHARAATPRGGPLDRGEAVHAAARDGRLTADRGAGSAVVEHNPPAGRRRAAGP